MTTNTNVTTVDPTEFELELELRLQKTQAVINSELIDIHGKLASIQPQIDWVNSHKKYIPFLYFVVFVQTVIITIALLRFHLLG